MPHSKIRLAGYSAKSPPQGHRPIVLITGAARGIGLACAEQLAQQGVDLILCDRDEPGVDELADRLGAVGLSCNVASEAGVRTLAGELLKRHDALDMVINAAGGGYERTLGMYRVSRALAPAMCRDGRATLVNIPPSFADEDTAVFPYASSGFAFQRLSAALALELRQIPVTVLIGSPASGALAQVLPDPNGGSWADSSRSRQERPEVIRTLVRQIALLVERDAPERRRAG